jgi:hypothetical protein
MVNLWLIYGGSMVNKSQPFHLRLFPADVLMVQGLALWRTGTKGLKQLKKV